MSHSDDDFDRRYFRDCEKREHEPTIRTRPRFPPLDARGAVKQRFEPDAARDAMTEAALDVLRKAGLL